MDETKASSHFHEIYDALDAPDVALITSEPVTPAQREAIELRGD